jgi:hypothetical protein
MTIWRICFACWMPMATDTHTQNVIRTRLYVKFHVHCPSCQIFVYKFRNIQKMLPFFNYGGIPPKTLAINICILNIKCVFRSYNLCPGKYIANSAENANKNTQQLFVYLSNVKFHADQFSCSRAGVQ